MKIREKTGSAGRVLCCILFMAVLLSGSVTVRADGLYGQEGWESCYSQSGTFFAAKKVKLKNCTVELSADSVVYTGNALRPKVTVKNGSDTLERGTDYTLAYSDNTKLGTGSVTVSGQGSYTGKVTKTFQIVLGVPELTGAVSAGYNAVTVTWKPVAGAKRYRLYYKGGSVTNWKGAKSGITGTTYTFKSDSLITGTNYTFTVRAVSGEHESSYDSTGKTAAPAPAQTKITNTKTAAKGIKLTWEKVEGADGYIIQKKSVGKWKTVKNIKSGTEVSCVDTKVEIGRLYSYRIRAYRTVNDKKISGLFSPIRIAKWM